VLVPAGVYGALLHVERIDVLVASPYGRALLVKLALAAPLLALGAVNHFRHVPAMSRGDAAAPALLARNVRIEVAVAAAVLLATALLGILPMPHVHAS
jgi:putative copper resistance protein D